MALRTLSAAQATKLDEELMSSGAFSIDQLMELAGLSVAQAVYKLHPPTTHPNILLAIGPGNNGGDGLVAARHLHHFSYNPRVFYPKRPNKPLYHSLTKQLENLSIPFVDDFPSALHDADYVVDAIFGFSFSGEVRQPFPSVIAALERTEKGVLAVDVPSSWDVEAGPPKSGLGSGYMPTAVVSLTAPKPLVTHLGGGCRHFVGGRFLGEETARRYEIDVPSFEGVDQVVEVPVR